MRTTFGLRPLSRLACRLLAAAVATAVPATAFGGERLVFPPDRALLAGGSIEALGFRPAASAAAQLLVTPPGAPPQTVPVPAGVFRVPLKLPPGESVIALGGASVRVFVPGPGAAAPATFSPADVHAVENSCEDCHQAGKDAMALAQPVPALCTGCHDDVQKGTGGKPHATPHPPVDEGDCLGCHAFHGRSLKQLPAAERRALCFGCHDDFTGDGKLRLHGPVGSGECGACHLVHGGPAKALLPAAGTALCVRCHKDPAKNAAGAAWSAPHPALDDGCPTCHLPHASAAPAMLKASQADLCGECHDGIVPAGDAGAVVHPPVADGECSACHRPHGADVGKLLRASGPALCTECHDDPAVSPGGEPWATGHPALDDGCLPCHLPHASPQAALLKKAQASLCFECHDAFPAPGADGAAPFVHAPVARGECAGCHAPHGSGEAKLLRAAGSALCLRCHKDPARTPEGGEWKVPHPALDEGCGACHRPHVAGAPKMLAKPQGEVCAGCHENKDLDPDGAPWPAPHAPVRRGSCGSCHGPHGANEGALLRKPPIDLCRGCHRDPHPNHLTVTLNDEGLPATDMVTLPDGFPVRKGDNALGCTGCHLPHGSATSKLWNLDSTLFCAQCHRY